MFLYIRLCRFLLVLATFVLPFVAFALGWPLWQLGLRLVGRSNEFSYGGHLGLLLIGALVWAFLADRYKVTNVEELFRERTGSRAATAACVATSLTFLAISYFSQRLFVPRVLFVVCMVTLLLLTILMRGAFRIFCRRRREWSKPTTILIVGADSYAREAAEKLRRLPLAPCKVVAHVRLPFQEIAVRDCPVYELDALQNLNAGHGIDELVIAIQPEQFVLIPTIIQALEKLSLPARAIVDLGEGIVVRERLFQLGRLQMLDLTTTPADSVDYALLKRVFDFCFAALVLLLTSPLLLLIAVLIRITSRGPVLFIQERVGLNGKPFKMYKFRTMKVSAPDSQEADTRWTTKADSRRTGLGVLLRETSLDELPQFFNVLRGDMSVVGPRPERPHFVRQFLHGVARYNHRHCLKVGITGWAQVNGWRGDTSIDKRIEYDLFYLENWSMGFDLRIIVMTIFSALTNKNAY